MITTISSIISDEEYQQGGKQRKNNSIAFDNFHIWIKPLDNNLNFELLSFEDSDNNNKIFLDWLFESWNLNFSRSYLLEKKLTISKFDNHGNVIEQFEGNFVCNNLTIEGKNGVKFQLKQI
jgi:hypothetical protein